MSLVNTLILKNGLKTKRYFTSVEEKDYEAIRLEEIRQVSFVKKPKNVNDEMTIIHGVKVHRISAQGNPTDKIIMYIHGGGFVTGSPESRTMFTYYHADKMVYNVVAVDYRLAPEHPFPAGVNDCIDVYEGLLSEYAANNIIIIGESAGANLTLVTLLKIKERGLEFPRASFAFSPCVQYDKVLESYEKNQNTESMVTNLSDEVKAVYVCSEKSEDVNNPYVSPLFGDFTFVLPLTDEAFTRELWEMATECPVVFPDGIGVVPWMVPGGREIAVETSKLLEKYDVAIWAHHGMFAAGEDFDLTFGLMHTVEKSAEILVKTLSMTGTKRQTITPDNFRNLAKDFNVNLPEKFLFEKDC